MVSTLIVVSNSHPKFFEDVIGSEAFFLALLKTQAHTCQVDTSMPFALPALTGHWAHLQDYWPCGCTDE